MMLAASANDTHRRPPAAGRRRAMPRGSAPGPKHPAPDSPDDDRAKSKPTQEPPGGGCEKAHYRKEVGSFSTKREVPKFRSHRLDVGPDRGEVRRHAGPGPE